MTGIDAISPFVVPAGRGRTRDMIVGWPTSSTPHERWSGEPGQGRSLSFGASPYCRTPLDCTAGNAG